ncbi:Uu.00g028000.m01.CDS01 [Anthostomella pinea]|uniref:Uu.00g028000.m01.CDS01 n=1 Tax=Anthostomella pinea TaxID=933095 RepID=A0AAI8V8E6_9PEZI|nr:Uu.00g028000.m01.CDS01 [Anthostomella pinea]
MGRRKIEIKAIKDDRNRSVTFLKRKGGLFKKAHELSVLCSVDVAVFIFGNNKKLYEYSNGDMRELITRYTYHGGPNEHKGPGDFHGGEDDDEDDGEGTPPNMHEGSVEPQMIPPHYQAQPPFPHLRHDTPSASPPINGMAFVQRGHTPQPQIVSRPSSRNDFRRPPNMPQPGGPTGPPPNGYAFMPHPAMYNPQNQPGMQHGPPPPPPGQYQYPPHQQPPHMQQYMLDQRSSMPPNYPPQPQGHQPPPHPQPSPPQIHRQPLPPRPISQMSPPQPPHQHLEHPQHGLEHPQHGLEHPQHGLEHPQHGMEHPQHRQQTPQPRQQSPPLSQQQQSQTQHVPEVQPPARKELKQEPPERPSQSLLDTASAIKKLPQGRKQHSIFTPIDENRSILSRHLASFKAEPQIPEEGSTRSQSVDVGTVSRTSGACSPPPPPQRSNTSTFPKSRNSTKRVPETTSTPPSRSNSFKIGSGGGTRPRLKVQIPDEASDAGSNTAESTTSPRNTADGTAHPARRNGVDGPGVVLPPPSPSASALLSAGATGPPNPFARPPPQSQNNNMNIDTPVSALPSRFLNNEFLPSPSSFYPEWNFRGNDSNTLPSPLNFATPVASSGPSFLRDDNGPGSNKRKSPEMNNAGPGSDGLEIQPPKRIKVDG